MKAFKVFAIITAVIIFAITPALSQEEGNPMAAPEEEEKPAVSGKIYFSDFYSMGGNKCSAFVETEDHDIVCVLDNMKTNDLKLELEDKSADVELSGNIIEDSQGRKYIKVEEYGISGEVEQE